MSSFTVKYYVWRGERLSTPRSMQDRLAGLLQAYWQRGSFEAIGAPLCNYLVSPLTAAEQYETATFQKLVFTCAQLKTDGLWEIHAYDLPTHKWLQNRAAEERAIRRDLLDDMVKARAAIREPAATVGHIGHYYEYLSVLARHLEELRPC